MRTLTLIIAIGLLSAPAAEGLGLSEPIVPGTDVETGWTPKSRFLLRPNTQMEYENFGWRRYRERGRGFDWFAAFDRMGEPWLIEAAEVFRWEEDRTRDPDFGSLLFRGLGRHNGVVVAKENFTNGAARVLIGDAVRTTFTSLTLDISRFTGVRADAIIGQNHELVGLTTRASDPQKSFRAQGSGTAEHEDGTLLNGLHWQGRFLEGAIFLGVTLVNHHRFDSMQRDGNYLKGTMPREMNPDSVVVRITDDSPNGGQWGAAVYGGGATLTVLRGGNQRRVIQGIRPVMVATDGVHWVDDHLDVRGADSYVEQVVPVPGSVVSVQNSPAVGQDFRLGTRQSHRALNPNNTFYQQEVRQTPVVTLGRASGNGLDEMRVIDLDYGLSSALNVSGLNGKLALGNLLLDWEFARSTAHFQFPEEQIGGRSSYSGDAYFVRATQDWSKIVLGGERFSISPKYNSYELDNGDFRLGDPKIGSGDLDIVDADYVGNNFDFFFNERQANDVKNGTNRRLKVFQLVEDNDDDDQYMDQSQNDVPVAVRTAPLYSGVYPGWDLDQDGTPDYNRNRNHIPDFAEPFFKYWQEEQVFNWGDDYNHNGVLDYFEDDSLPDYPYYKDERGGHYFVELATPLPSLRLGAGFVRIEQIAASGKSDENYLSASYRRIFPGRARLRWEHEFKSVEDNVPNNGFQYFLTNEVKVGTGGVYESVFVEDALTMRDSRIHRGYVGTSWTPGRNVNLHNNLRYELNHQNEAQFADGTAQVKDDINTWAMVNKADYTWIWRGLTLQPKIKHTLLKQNQLAGFAPGGLPAKRDVTEIAPILQLSYIFTERTAVELGAEGFPFFQERFIDRDDELADFKSQTYLAQVKMKGRSSGFNVFITTGLQYTKQKFDEPGLPSGSFVRSYVQVFVGEQILAASE